MRKLFIITVLAGFWASNLYAVEPLKVKSKVKSVTLFFSGAELVHESSAALVKGNNEILVRGLSPAIDVNSLKIKIYNADALVSSFVFVKEQSDESPTVARMRDTLRLLNDDLAKVNLDVEINKDFQQILKTGIEKSFESENKSLSLKDLLEYYEKKYAAGKMSLFELENKSKDINKKIAELNNRINKALKEQSPHTGALKLSITARNAANCRLSVSYYTNLAGWTPCHDIKVENSDSPVQITSKAQVRQTTGIDWEQVKLTFSTSSPSGNKSAPLFSAWILDEKPPVYPRFAGAASTRAVQNSISYSKSALADEVAESEALVLSDESMNTHVSLSENEMNIAYEIDLPYTVKGDGETQNIELVTQEAVADYKYYCAPKLAAEVFLIADIRNREKLNLLSAKASITYNGVYTGETYINAASVGETLSLTLGVEQRVGVKREKVGEMSSSRLLGNDVKQEFTYRISVRNNQNRTIKIVVKDNYPKSNRKQIDVNLLKTTTPPSFNNEETGVLTWERELGAGESASFTTAYSVKYPETMKLF